MPIAVSLLPWESRVGAGCGRVELTVEGERAVVHKDVDVGAARPDGWFAIYEGAVFGLFEWPGSKDCQVALFVEGRVWRLTSDVQLSSSHTLTHRSFSLKSGSGVVVFNYQRLWWNLLHKPKAALLDVVFADDWWGVVCDLPGWVAVRWQAGKLAEELAGSLKERDGR